MCVWRRVLCVVRSCAVQCGVSGVPVVCGPGPASCLCSVARAPARPPADASRQRRTSANSRPGANLGSISELPPVASPGVRQCRSPSGGGGWLERGLFGLRAVPPKRAGCVRPVERDEPDVESASRRLAHPAPQVCMYRVWVLTGPYGCVSLEQERKQRAHALEFCTSHLHTEMEARC